jgi:hypothetical protein
MKVNIRKGRGIKPVAAIRNWLVIVMAGMTLLTGVSCQDKSPVNELEDAATADKSFWTANRWFWVELTVSSEINMDYEPVRLLVTDTSRQLGAVSVYGTDKYKITIPESKSDMGDSVYLVTEFTKRGSKFDGSSYSFSNNSVKLLIVSFLKARYCATLKNIPPQGGTVQLNIDDITEFNLGYGPSSMPLGSIADAPYVYIINLDTSALEQYGLTVTRGIAVEEGTPLTPDLYLEDPNLGLGFAAPETDWMLLLDTELYFPGDPLTFWFTMERDTRYPPPPCESPCVCSPCICSNSSMVSPVIIDINDVPIETGSTIDIKLEASDLQCVQIPTP